MINEQMASIVRDDILAKLEERKRDLTREMKQLESINSIQAKYRRVQLMELRRFAEMVWEVTTYDPDDMIIG